MKIFTLIRNYNQTLNSLKISISSVIKNNQISNEEKVFCEEQICKGELLNANKGLENGKSPGTDGLSPDFYKFFWTDLNDALYESITHSLKYRAQKRGILTLIPKKRQRQDVS